MWGNHVSIQEVLKVGIVFLIKFETPPQLLGWFPKFYPVFISEVSPSKFLYAPV